MADARFSNDLIEQMIDGVGDDMNAGTLYTRIYKGAFPDQDPSWSYLNSTRYNDRLVTFAQGSQDLSRWAATVNVLSLNSDKIPAPTAAAQSGTATWFAIYREGGIGIAGTVTAIGGGGDLTIADTNIVAGLTYSFSPVSFTFPKSVTY